MVSQRTFEAVASQWRPVDAEGGQGRYIRAASAHQTSDALKWHQRCVAEKMQNNSGDQSDIREAFSEAASECEDENPHN